ncbi:hypothetical protein ACOSQ4_013208 [Xanthoceras sorbifolium]
MCLFSGSRGAYVADFCAAGSAACGADLISLFAACGVSAAPFFAALGGSAAVLFPGVKSASGSSLCAALGLAVSASVSAVMPFPGVGAASSSAPCAAACDVFGAVPTLGFVIFGSFATVPPPGG